MFLLATLLTVLFVGLKLGGIIAWSWLLVVCPIPLYIALIASPILIGFVFVVMPRFVVNAIKAVF